MDNRPDIFRLLADVLDERGYPVTPSDVYSAINNIAMAAVHSNMPKQGAPGMMGPMGQDGKEGRPAWDKYAWDPAIERLIDSKWKGISFQFPLMRDFFEGFPEGELSYGDINYIRTIYGNAVVERMAMFWRREYEYLSDIQLFIDKEDATCLTLTNKSNSYPAPLQDC